jgi:iodotyrosine deiodinase
MPLRLRPLSEYREVPAAEMATRAEAFAVELSRRRTVRDFSDRPIPPGVVDACLRAAGSAPSGANLQPWHFVVVTDPAIKRRIRESAEAEEREFYERRATPEWLAALEPLGTDAAKPFLEIAPVLIAIFGEAFGEREDGSRVKHYYVAESVGIAAGMLIAAVHLAGLASLTHTPSPMGFLNEVLGRPARERPFLLLVVGYPAAGAQVPDIARKPLDAIRSIR